MRQFDYLVEITAPVCFTEQSGDNVLYETKKYIPGSSLLGAFANKYIKEHKLNEAHKNAVFRELFLSAKVRFLPAYPCTGEGVRSMPLPLSIMIHKDGKTIADYSSGDDFKAGFKKLSGFASFDEDNKEICTMLPKVQFEFHMSRASELERLSGSSNEGHVFNYEYLEPFQYFGGTVVFDDDCSKESVNVLKALLAGNIGLGRSKNVQYGASRLSCTHIAEDKPVIGIDTRVYLYAYSAYVPACEWGRTDELTGELADELNNALQKAGSKGRLLKSNTSVFAAKESLDGYVGVWGIKRERKQTLVAGSLLGFDVVDWDSKASQVLQERLYEGFGERRAEGFGQFRVWKPLVNCAEMRWHKVKFVEKQGVRPSLDAVRIDAITIIAGRIMQEVRLQAKNDALSIKAYEKGKGTLKRIEALADSDCTKEEVLETVRAFRKTAKTNLLKMCFRGMNVLDCILEQENMKQPYAGIDWLHRIGLEHNNALALKNDLGFDELPVTEEEIFKEYWLWFARHGVKSIKKKEQSAGFSLEDAVTAIGKEGANE